MSISSRTGGLALAFLATPLAGCFSGFQPSLLTMQGIKKPIMLTPVDRIGGGAPLPTQKVGEYEGESISIHTEHEDSQYRYSFTKVNNVQAIVDAQKALAKTGPNGAIKVNTLRAWARGWPAGVKNTVYIDGDVVNVGGGQ